jgi:hypothetical protein
MDRMQEEMEAEVAAADDYEFQVRRSVAEDMANNANDADD